MNFLFAITLIAYFLLLDAASTSSPSLPTSSPALSPSSPPSPSPPSLPSSQPPLPSWSPPSSASPGCSDDLLAFSSCLSYVSAPPNDITDTPTPPCCVAFSAVFNSIERDCFCYLLKQPSLFGFPLNQSRLLSLPQICNPESLSLESVCSGSTMAALPPLRSTTGSSPTGSGFPLPPDNFTSPTPPETAVGSLGD